MMAYCARALDKGSKTRTNRSCQNITQQVLNGESLPCLINSGSSSVIPSHSAHKFNLKRCNVQKGLSITQTKDVLTLTEKCFVNLKIGCISKTIELLKT